MSKKIKSQDIISILDMIEDYLTKYNISSHDITCCKLIVEDVYLNYREKLNCSEFKISFKKNNGKIHAKLEFECEEYNPFNDSENIIINNTLSHTTANYSHKYKGGKNIIDCEFKMIITVFRNFLYILKFLKNQKKEFIFAVSIQICMIVLSVSIPLISANIISKIAISDIKKIVIMAGILFIVHALNNLSEYLANCLHNRISNRIMNDVEMELSRNILEMDTNSIEKNGTGMIIQRMTNDTVQISTGFDTLTSLIADLIYYISTLVAILIINPILFAVKLATLIVLVIIQLKQIEKFNSDDRDYRVLNDKFTSIVGEMVRGSKDVKLLHSEDQFTQKIKDAIKKTNRQHLKSLDTYWNYALAGGELSKLCEFLFYTLIALFILKGSITPTNAIVVFNYSATLIIVPIFIRNFLQFLQKLSLSSERLYHLVNSKDFVREKFGKKHIENIKGEIEFENVWFSYKGNGTKSKDVKVLNGMNLKINSGETVAFVGKSGCGKTTALNLIAKIFSVNSGSVLIDGIDIEQLDKNSLRSNITMVSQNPYVFNMSVRENLKIVKPDLTDEEMIDVCKKACIHDDILSFADGYDTIIGESGVNISGGQCQRLALARSFLTNSSIILFDEATSALDNATQSKIKDAISNLHNKKTLVIVAHRLSTIKDCDKIFYFKDGVVLAYGTHDELMQSCNEYHDLYSTE